MSGPNALRFLYLWHSIPKTKTKSQDGDEVQGATVKAMHAQRLESALWSAPGRLLPSWLFHCGPENPES